MKSKGMWAILIASTLFVSILLTSYPATACYGQTTSCEGESVYQGDGGSTDYWYADLYPPTHEMDKGYGTDWLINVQGGGGCSQYEHATFSDNAAPPGWVTSIKMGTIYSGSFHYIEPGNPTVNTGDNIEGREFYVGSSWNFDVIYNVTSPAGAAGGEYADQVCTVYMVGYNPENQHTYVYLHLRGKIFSAKPPMIMVTFPGLGNILSGSELITWDASTVEPSPAWVFEIYLSPDMGKSFPYTLATGITGPGPTSFSWLWDTTAYPDDDQYILKIKGFDGAEWGEAFSPGNFTIENVAPDPPSELLIYFGLETNCFPDTKDVLDDTGSDLERLEMDDSRAYGVHKGYTMSLDTFDTLTQVDPVESALLVIEYWVEDAGYGGFNSVEWRLDGGIWASTGITPTSSDLMPQIGTVDLYAAGVDTIDKITNLDIRFINDDGGADQQVNFDYIWVVTKASLNDLGLTWQPSTALDFSYYNIYRSADAVSYSPIYQTSNLFYHDTGTATDLNDYYYRIHSVDFGGSEGIPTYVVGKYVSSATSGWNLASSPLEPLGDTSVTNVLTSIDGNYNAVQEYDAGDWQHNHESKPGYMNSIGGMDHKHGYYLDVEATDDLIFLGRLRTTETISLKAGWNLVGYPSINAEQWDTALSTILPNCDIVFRYDTGTGREVEVSGSDNLEPGTGYWIHVSSDCTLIL
jgi:hypothetical protein